MLHAGQCVNRGTHDLMARFAFYVGDQAETTVVPLLGFIVQHISEPPQALRDSHNRLTSGLLNVRQKSNQQAEYRRSAFPPSVNGLS
ncbi:hypothetical protein D3C81_1954100 [compost metagenome]